MSHFSPIRNSTEIGDFAEVAVCLLRQEQAMCDPTKITWDHVVMDNRQGPWKTFARVKPKVWSSTGRREVAGDADRIYIMGRLTFSVINPPRCGSAANARTIWHSPPGSRIRRQNPTQGAKNGNCRNWPKTIVICTKHLVDREA